MMARGGNEDMPIFHCVNCHYTFEADKMPEKCPDCGKERVRVATTCESEDYKRIRRELDEEQRKQDG